VGTHSIAVLVTVAFSMVGVVGDYFLKLASTSERPLRTGSSGLSWPSRRSCRWCASA